MSDQPTTGPDIVPGSPSLTVVPPAVPDLEAPPAASVVASGARTEREINLEKELESEKAARRSAEFAAAAALDEAARLKQVQSGRPPKKVPADRWTLLHPVE